MILNMYGRYMSKKLARCLILSKMISLNVFLMLWKRKYKSTDSKTKKASKINKKWKTQVTVITLFFLPFNMAGCLRGQILVPRPNERWRNSGRSLNYFSRALRWKPIRSRSHQDQTAHDPCSQPQWRRRQSEP